MRRRSKHPLTESIFLQIPEDLFPPPPQFPLHLLAATTALTLIL